MKGAKGYHYSRIYLLLSSAACVAALSLSSGDAHARGLFSEAGAVPAIEVNLDAINNAKRARKIAQENAEKEAALRVQRLAEEKQKAAEEMAARQQAEKQALEEAQVSEVEEAESDTQEAAERLPIIVKKVDAPVAPMYKSDKVVPDSVVTESDAAREDNRTVASMFRDLFYGDEVEEDASIAQNDEGEVEDSSEEVATVEKIEVPKVELKEIPELKVVEEQAELAEAAEVEEESGLSLWIDEDEQPVNQVEIKEEERAERDEPSFFDRFLGAFDNDTEEKKQSIKINRPVTASAQQENAPSIFNDSESEFKVVGGVRELLDEGEEEVLVKDDAELNTSAPVEVPIAEKKLAEPEAIAPRAIIPEGAQVILPNEIDKNDDVFGVTPTPAPRPVRVVEKVEQKEVEEFSEPGVIENTIAEKQEVEVAQVPKISSLEDKQIPSPAVTESMLDAPTVSPVLNENSSTTLDTVVEQKDANVDSDAPIELAQPSIPTPAEVIEKELEQEELVAEPIVIKEKASDEGFFAKAKSWFGGDKEKTVPQPNNVVEVPAEALNEHLEGELGDEALPASLPEPVDISAAEEKLESLNVAIQKRQQEKAAEIENATSVTEPVEVIGDSLPLNLLEGSPAIVKNTSEAVEVASLAAPSVSSEKSVDTIAEEKEYILPENALLGLTFSPAQSEIPAADIQKIKDAAAKIKDDQRKRLKIKSYASPMNDRAGSARRMSLQRAIAIRSVMVQNGIEGVRINVQALGDAAQSGGKDRAEILVIED